MAYREVTMVEVKEVLRLWLGDDGQAAHRRPARDSIRRRCVATSRPRGRVGWSATAGVTALSDELVGQVLAARRGCAHRPHGDTWSRCAEQREFIERHLRARVRLSKIRKLLRRQGVEIPYATLRRWAVATLGFGRTAPTLPVVDGKPGDECQLDTGWVLTLEPDARGKRRRLRAWIFTAGVSRHRFVYPIWCRDEYGMRRHSTTQRRPREHFETSRTGTPSAELLPKRYATASLRRGPMSSSPRLVRRHPTFSEGSCTESVHPDRELPRRQSQVWRQSG